MRNRWLLTLGAITLAAVSGCSVLIAKSGVSSVGEIYKLDTRAEVRDTFGEPDETGTCPDGRIVERRTIRQQVPWVCHDSSGCKEALVRSVGVFDVFLVPVMAYQSEQAKLHYAFVYGADDRVLYRYNVTASPSERMVSAVRPLTVALYGQLDERGCPSWEGCLSAYAVEVRQRAACVGYTLTPEEAETLQLLEALAAEVDAGRLTPDDTLAELHWCLGSAPLSWSCHRP
jgi:hypothetical protein